MREKLEAIKRRFDALEERLASPGAMADQNAWRAMVKEHADLSEIVREYELYKELEQAKADCRAMLLDDPDPEMKEMARCELDELRGREEALLERLKLLLSPKDPNDDRDVIIEIRAGTGGDEAALFGADLLRMYLRYAERHGYKVEYITSNTTDMGGVKEVVISVGGKRGAYSRLKYESGVHRVQRVPETESQGRIHTSAATVAVLPEADDVDVDIKDSDLRIDTYRSSGAGGQHVNKTDSAIRITHLPTGLVVACQDERSQLKNKEQAMRLLKSRLLEIKRQEQDEKLAQTRKSQVGSGDRSERIRTHNFPQNRVTDHRVGLTLYKLDQFLDGDMDEMIDALILAENAAKLASVSEYHDANTMH
ncbi:MAG: peptide chain release factor 1 [Clostridiales bacterium]|jgi:peptide chain release factor 1|nr:peptide chain release factor 1 [Clostridiales bacterium]